MCYVLVDIDDAHDNELKILHFINLEHLDLDSGDAVSLTSLKKMKWLV